VYKRRTLSVVMPAYNEADGITSVVRAFAEIPEVDEIIVADNNSSDGTGDLAKRAGARVVLETRQGYGFACRAALEASTGDYTVIVESDATFRASDLYKFMAYAEDFDAVFGTRTSKACIWSGANMGWFLRCGNVAVAKLLEYLHNGPCMTDVGCTYKLFTRRSLSQLLPLLTVGDSRLSPEILIVIIRMKLHCIEIPVNYGSRLGTSKITGSLVRAIKLGLRMILLIFRCRLITFPEPAGLESVKEDSARC
jgi:glycosyltransferase involved in cell wall biosynthesis